MPSSNASEPEEEVTTANETWPEYRAGNETANETWPDYRAGNETELGMMTRTVGGMTRIVGGVLERRGGSPWQVRNHAHLLLKAGKPQYLSAVRKHGRHDGS